VAKKLVPVTLYLDVWPGMDLSMVIASARPSGPPFIPGSRRFRVDFTIDDPNLPDDVITTPPAREVPTR
jgi:hypothetical protein